METTRHFVTSVYVVHDGATLLHEHDRLGLWLPPGGHIDRDELPHKAARREVREETGLDITLVTDQPGPQAEQARPLPRPQQLQLEDINVHEEAVGHQHIDFVYYAHTTGRTIDPAPGEQPAADWQWFDQETLVTAPEALSADVIDTGRDAIRTVMAADM